MSICSRTGSRRRSAPSRSSTSPWRSRSGRSSPPRPSNVMYGRVYLIVLDDLHTHPLRTQLVKAAARRFIERNFGANDIAAVVHTSGRSDAGQDFTANRRMLLGSVDRFMGNSLRSGTLERLDEFNRQSFGGQPVDKINDPTDMERGFHARNTIDTLKKLADFMAGIRGRRKAMLFISEGIDYDTTDVFNNRSASMILDSVRDAVGAATRANVSIYGIDPRGLKSFPDDQKLGINLSAMQNALRLSQDSLRTLSEETGGFAVVNRNDFGTAFDRIVRENSAYYVLGFYPTNEKRDGRFRKLEVRVKRPGLRVRSRRGYLAPRGRAPETKGPPNVSVAMRDALSSPLPMHGVPMTVFAAPFKGTAPNATVSLTLELEAGLFQYAEKDGAFTNLLETGVTAVDAKGKVFPGQRQTVTLAFKPDTLSRVKSRGFRVLSQVDLPPGRYQLRVAAAESGGKSGSVLYDLEVPDFYKPPIAMSGLVLTSASAGQAPTAAGKQDPVLAALPAPPTTAREFARGDELALFTEIYENAPGATPHKLDITTTMRAEDGRVVLQNREERASTELQGGRGGYGYLTRIPLKDYAPGLYVIHVEGRSRTSGDERGVGRDIQIRIR
ncbi:MAG: VWA domain-containing protein [Actinobacteria bacterium]|nr:MAG: VWA domain-containing protein [Actinomycetota bacterium]